MAEAGADVICTSRRMEQVETAAEIENLGGKTSRVASDAADRQSLETLLKETVGSFGKVHILVNSAGRTICRSSALPSTGGAISV